MNNDKLIIGGHEFTSRFILGSGKYSMHLIEAAVKAGKPTVIDVRIDKDEMVLPMLPPGGAISDIITKV